MNLTRDGLPIRDREKLFTTAEGRVAAKLMGIRDSKYPTFDFDKIPSVPSEGSGRYSTIISNQGWGDRQLTPLIIDEASDV